MIVTGIGVALGPLDSRPFLKSRKSRKYMGVQDELAVVAAGRALEGAGLHGPDAGDRVGLYLAVGFIPFLREDMEPLAWASARDGRFSPEAFATEGDLAANPLLTFRCLPNMPAYHVSANFGVTGPYVVSYPGPAQMLLVLAEAVEALAKREVDIALVGGVAHQRNFLVEHHFSRLAPPVPRGELRDAGGFLVLERESDRRRGSAGVLARLDSLDVTYDPEDPFGDLRPPEEKAALDAMPLVAAGNTGAASHVLALAAAREAGGGEFTVRLTSRDGYRAAVRWVLP